MQYRVYNIKKDFSVSKKMRTMEQEVARSLSNALRAVTSIVRGI